MPDIKERLQNLRGSAYFDVWADWWKDEGQPVRVAVAENIANCGRLTPRDLVVICARYDLPWKTFVEQLEKDGQIPTGTYGRLPPIKKLRQRLCMEAN